MPISTNRAIAACKKNKDQKCHFFLPAQGLPTTINEDDVHVWRTTSTPHVEIPVHQATVVPGRNTAQVLIVRTKKIKDSIGCLGKQHDMLLANSLSILQAGYVGRLA